MSGRQKEVKETKKSSSAKLSKNGVRMLLRGEVAKEGVVLQVVQLYRYLIDDYFNTRTGIATTAQMFAYDLVLSDGRFKTKCLMDPSFNQLVNKGHLRVNTIINILDGHKYADELTVGAIQYFQVTRLEIVDSNVQNLLRDQSKKNGELAAAELQLKATTADKDAAQASAAATLQQLETARADYDKDLDHGRRAPQACTD